jgi:hypothetical protein
MGGYFHGELFQAALPHTKNSRRQPSRGYPRSGITSPNAGISCLDLASNFPRIPQKLVVAPIAPTSKQAGFEEFEFAVSIDGTLDCPRRP